MPGTARPPLGVRRALHNTVRPLTLLASVLACLGCEAAAPEIRCGDRECTEVPAPAVVDSCAGSDWFDDGGRDDAMRSAIPAGVLIPADGDVQGDDLFPAGDIDRYQWSIAMNQEPIAISAQSLALGGSLEVCAAIETDGGPGARCTAGVERIIDDRMHCCGSNDEANTVIVTPDSRVATSGLLTVRVAVGIGGHCDRYALSISTP